MSFSGQMERADLEGRKVKSEGPKWTIKMHYVLKLEFGKHWGISLDRNTIFVGRAISERKGRKSRERKERNRNESRVQDVLHPA